MQGTLGAVDQVAARELRRRVWLPVERVLGPGTRTVLVAPDSDLAELPLGALPGSKPGTYLIEERAFAHVLSGRELIAGADNTPAGTRLLVLGGLSYGKGRPAGRLYVDLPGTRLEAQQVVRLWRSRFPRAPRPRLLQGDQAGKPDLVRLLSPARGEPRWGWLHLATHGYSNPLASGRDILAPLLHDGLVLSGVNSNPERGLLLAEEVASLDMRGTDLVVLSACETALGEVSFGEGVFGLQRAFHLAGAKTLVASLWNVSDPATSVLMEEFYKRLWSKEKPSKLEALRHAQLFVLGHPDVVRARMKELGKRAGAGVALRGEEKEGLVVLKGKPAHDKRSPPAWWAAFVLSGRQ
jgi:CHAT domain-containing protein